MPTVSYKCPDSGKNKKRKFAYNAVGKAQSDAFARLKGGKVKMNPGPEEEVKTKSTNVHKDIVRKRDKIDFETYVEPKKNKKKSKSGVEAVGGAVQQTLAAVQKLKELRKKNT